MQHSEAADRTGMLCRRLPTPGLVPSVTVHECQASAEEYPTVTSGTLEEAIPRGPLGGPSVGFSELPHASCCLPTLSPTAGKRASRDLGRMADGVTDASTCVSRVPARGAVGRHINRRRPLHAHVKSKGICTEPTPSYELGSASLAIPVNAKARRDEGAGAYFGRPSAARGAPPSTSRTLRRRSASQSDARRTRNGARSVIDGSRKSGLRNHGRRARLAATHSEYDGRTWNEGVLGNRDRAPDPRWGPSHLSPSGVKIRIA
ncbi:hypothetical protein HPB47_012356 [Ixodes persulcatus]|uniref:Uncharacterized protein n=1 Tax=Ixodes persulcatus TaxID=34615 RepID=A0AC60NTM2_IXOPE|nr:hypothetical protein HPB47_012356 [Ixodes persulcatus]